VAGIEERRLDGLRAVRVDEGKFSQMVGGKLRDRALIDEMGVSLAVVNATGYDGLATQVASTLVMTGYDVVSTTDAEVSKQSFVWMEKGVKVDDKVILWPLKHILGLSVEEKEGLVGEYRAQLVVILGEDYWRRLNQSSD